MPIRAVLMIAFCAAVFLLPASGIQCAQDAVGVSIIPQPMIVHKGQGVFTINSDTKLYSIAEHKPAADYLGRLLGLEVKVIFIPWPECTQAEVACAIKGYDPSNPLLKIPVDLSLERGDPLPQNAIIIADEAMKGPSREWYNLEVAPERIVISAGIPQGAFYGIQTLRQIALQDQGGVQWSFPGISIHDRPRFKWRGLMIDVARHFQPKEEIFKIIDAMAMFKLNTLHMHLVDDQGWRLEIDAFPQLTKIGSKREASGKFDLCMSPAGDAHQGFYTRDDMRAIIAYAAERFITVVPEIELPGHATAAIASVKGLSCLNKRFKVSNCWGVHPDIFCAGEEKVFEFLEKVLAEVAELFPGPYIHIGGDEAPKDRWKACPKCQKRIKDEGLKDEHELQSWFISRIEKRVNALGKQIIGWDEILEGGLPPRAAVMSWRGMQGGTDAAMQGHDVVMSPTSHCYLDYRQSAQPEPNAVGPVTTLEKTYSFEPVPEGLAAEAAKHIMGVQGNLWTEHIATPEHLQYMAFPRALAIAEVAWSAGTARDWAGFSRRLPAALALLKRMGVNYRQPLEGELAK